ncbi:DUF397 domain-containing protein [Streptomyces sp. NPDC056716]|uniref:DUF397 domain-containing protein n=1 Tax=unclassified Streptomyces TaxID=2593676 RepID=UPI0036AB1B15
MAPESAWFKSSYSEEQGGNCLEVADLSTAVGIRDSKHKSGPALIVPATAWTTFIHLVRTGAAPH